MTPTARYRAIAALSRLEGMAHALRVDLAEGKAPSLEVLDSLAQDVAAVRRATRESPDIATLEVP